MSSNSMRGRMRAHRVIIVGLKGNQTARLKLLLDEYPVKVDSFTQASFLRRKRLEPDVLVMTGFIGHKHSLHARAITNAPIQICRGASAATIAVVIIRCLGLGALAENNGDNTGRSYR